jgi:hypothetical protein
MLKNPVFPLMITAVLLSACCTRPSAGTDAAAEVDAGDAGEDGGAADALAADSGTDADSGSGADGSAGDAGSGDGGMDSGGGPPWYECNASPAPEGSTTVTVFDRAAQYFSQQDDKRTIAAAANLPASGPWKEIRFRLLLECPADGKCDWWDRLASVSLLENPGATDERALELERYVTPYRVGFCFETDVTAFASVLSGERTFRSFIDTWVGPSSTNGHGWRVTVKLIFVPGTPAANPPKVINLMPPLGVVVGDPQRPVKDQAKIGPVKIETTLSTAMLRMIATGHGQGNLDNCAEFCGLDESMEINGSASSRSVWRSDCAENPLGSRQKGTWQYDRDGWCPGAYVIPVLTDVTGELTAGADNTFIPDVLSGGATYVNTCRPGAGGAENICDGCVFSGSKGNCDYNGGDHTEPYMQTSYQLFLY